MAKWYEIAFGVFIGGIMLYLVKSLISDLPLNFRYFLMNPPIELILFIFLLVVLLIVVTKRSKD